MNKKNNLAFTLVELIVVITILAILGTIAFISLQGYSSQARDSKRLSDISNIKKSLELFSLNSGKYPLADDYFTISYSGEFLRHQGTIGEQVSTNLSRNLNEKPVDPLTGSEYNYSTTYSQTEYEVLGLYESDLLGLTSPLLRGIEGDILLQSNAATQDYPKIDGNYNGIYIKTSSFYVPTPSIINAELLSSGDLDNDNIKSQIMTGLDNIPGISTGGLDIRLSVYTGTINNDSIDNDRIDLINAIQLAYTGSNISNNAIYGELLSYKTDEAKLNLIDFIVLNNENTQSISVISDDDTPVVISPIGDNTVFYLNGDGADFLSDEVDTERIITNVGGVTYDSSNGYTLDGTNYLYTPDTTEWDFTGDFTIDYWVKFDSLSTYISWILTSSNGGTWLMQTFGDKISFFDINYQTGDTTLVTDTRYHIALVRNGTDSDNCTFYVNGLNDGTFTSDITIGGTASLMVGAYLGNSTESFKGSISNIRITNGEALWDENFTPPERN